MFLAREWLFSFGHRRWDRHVPLECRRNTSVSFFERALAGAAKQGNTEALWLYDVLRGAGEMYRDAAVSYHQGRADGCNRRMELLIGIMDFEEGLSSPLSEYYRARAISGVAGDTSLLLQLAEGGMVLAMSTLAYDAGEDWPDYLNWVERAAKLKDPLGCLLFCEYRVDNVLDCGVHEAELLATAAGGGLAAVIDSDRRICTVFCESLAPPPTGARKRRDTARQDPAESQVLAADPKHIHYPNTSAAETAKPSLARRRRRVRKHPTLSMPHELPVSGSK